MDEGMDTGPILLQQEEAVDETDDAGSLGARLAAIGGRLLVDTLDRLEAEHLGERPQDPAMATLAPKLKQEEEVIDWSRSSMEIVRQVRALAPVPGARTTLRGRTLKVFGAEARRLRFPPSHIPPSGTVVPIGPGERASAFGVSTGDGWVVVLQEVALEGRKHMTGQEFLRGNRPEPGEILGR
jgi:methionyl-tRNA formyltransferase